MPSAVVESLKCRAGAASVARAAIAVVAAGFAAAALAQDPAPYPGRSPVEITVLFPAGTSADVTARLLAEGMAKHLGTTVLVVNRPGGGGAVGYRHVAAQKPDGGSLVWNSNSVSTTYHSGQLPFDYRAFDAVARVLVESPVLAVRGDAKWKTLGELIEDGRSRGGRLTLGNSGLGSHTHITAVAFARAAGMEVVDVPFAAAQVVPSLIGGHVDALVQLPAALSTHQRTGQVRFLAAMIPKRDPAFPDVPTAAEQGVNVSLEAWRGIAAPKGTPPAVLAALESTIRKVVESADFARGTERLGVRPAFLGAGEFGELIAREDAEVAELMDAIGLRKKP